MARGWRYTKASLASSLLCVAGVRVCYLKAMHPFLFYGFPRRLGAVPVLSGIAFFILIYFPFVVFPFKMFLRSCPVQQIASTAWL